MPCDYQQLPHVGIRTLQPYIPGKSIEELAREEGITDIIKLASNENPYGCSERVNKALAKMTGLQISSYPAPHCHPISQRLSQKLGIAEDRITLSNGSDYLFALLLALFGLHNNKSMLTHEKAFITYSILAQSLGISFVTVPLKADWQVDIDAIIRACHKDIGVIFLANPNNPTGLPVSHNNIRKLLAGIPETSILVVDEAYHEFYCDRDDRHSLLLLDEFPNLVLTRTFSKAYGLAGLRLGYALAASSISELLRRVQLPFTVNQAAMTAGLAALDDEEFLNMTLTMNAAGMLQMQKGLDALHCYRVPSSCNFITFDCGQSSLPIYQGLLKQGIIVRPLSAYGLPNHLRVTIGQPHQNERFLETLEKELQHEQ